MAGEAQKKDGAAVISALWYGQKFNNMTLDVATVSEKATSLAVDFCGPSGADLLMAAFFAFPVAAALAMYRWRTPEP